MIDSEVQLKEITWALCSILETDSLISDWIVDKTNWMEYIKTMQWIISSFMPKIKSQSKLIFDKCRNLAKFNMKLNGWHNVTYPHAITLWQ